MLFRQVSKKTSNFFFTKNTSSIPIAFAATLLATYGYAHLKEIRNEKIHDKYIDKTDEIIASRNHKSYLQKIAHLPRNYDRRVIEQYWEGRPVTVTQRVVDVMKEALPMIISVIYEFHIKGLFTDDNPAIIDRENIQRHYASKLREVLTRLGPAFVKCGQQLSIRPDLIPPPVVYELQKLCDAVTPVPDEVAMKVLCEELGLKNPSELSCLFEDIELVASASLGQVYKATTVDTKETVAIKVQRPDMLRLVSLDLFLLSKLAKIMDRFTATFTSQSPYHVDLLNTFAEGSYNELDYEKEASNQLRFLEEFKKRKTNVIIPPVYLEYTSRRVLTTGWIEGVKLVDADSNHIRKLIPVGVELFLTQLLDIGFFHADPHPGNLFVTHDGQLCLLDFGLCAYIDQDAMHAMTASIVHLLIGDFEALIAEDAKNLGFLPRSLDTTELQPILSKILTEGLLEPGSDLHKRKKKLMQISNELNEVFFRYPFSVPPFFALVTRGLGLLEGIALSGDPSFDIFRASYPYARKRAVDIFGQHGINHMKRKMTERIKQN